MPERGLWDVSRRTLRAGLRWGTVAGGNLVRGSANWVQPVVDVDRPRYDDVSGSLYGLTNGTVGAIGELPACVFLSGSDWELHEINAFWTHSAATGLGAANDRGFHMFTPQIGVPFYDAVANNLVGPFVPGLVASYQLDVGSMLAFGGTQAFLWPGGLGLEMSRVNARDDTHHALPITADAWTRTYDFVPATSVNRITGADAKMTGRKFSPPMRFPAGRELACQVVGRFPADFNDYPVELSVSILYNELEDFGAPLGQ